MFPASMYMLLYLIVQMSLLRFVWQCDWATVLRKCAFLTFSGSVLVGFDLLTGGHSLVTITCCLIFVFVNLASFHPDNTGFHLHKLKVVAGWPQVWRMLQWLLPKKIRTTLYEPARRELFNDYNESLLDRTSKFGFWWLQFCFTIRTIILMLGCWKELVADVLLPAPIKRWLNL